MPLFAPTYLYHPTGWLESHVLEADEQGFILDFRPRRPEDRVETLPGFLIPGLVNAHCHLELSHLAGKISPGMGMTHFIGEIFALRNSHTEAEQLLAIKQAMKAFQETGTVAVGDICNTALTVPAKSSHPDIATHSFLELPGLDPSRADHMWSIGEALQLAFAQLPHSLSPHAPYSTSLPLLRRIYANSERLSIHLLESEAEMLLFDGRKGPLAEAFDRAGIKYPDFPDQHPVSYLLRDIPAENHVLWVHCLWLTVEALHTLISSVPGSYFCLCPRSNRYLHGRSPDLRTFQLVQDRLCLGTDSLASNWDLDLWQEVRELRSLPHAPDFHRVVKMATTQGAAALGMAERLGTFHTGSKPGLLWVASADAEKVVKIM